MYEAGVGVARDGHLAKRFYDLTLEKQKLHR
jgi:TPR repeat protein